MFRNTVKSSFVLRGHCRTIGNALLFFIGLLTLAVGPANPARAVMFPQQGLVKEPPKQGRFVKTDLGYMVPYSVTIPGTDVSFLMLPVPGGQFKMGSPESEKGRSASEGPQLVVKVEPFWIGAHEVTWAEYHQYMALRDIFRKFQEKGIRTLTKDREIDAVTAPSKLYDPDTAYESGDDPRQPAVMMTQYAAKQYTKWLSAVAGNFYRLPAEAEWEYACRAGAATAFHCGDDASKLGGYGWYDDNAEGRTHIVGQKKPNAWGLFDMHGNVAEWVLDQYTANGYGNFDKQQPENGAVIKWPTTAFPRVVRGGSFEMEATECRSASRLASDDEAWKEDDPNLPASPWWNTTSPATGIGFRILRPLKAPQQAETRERFWKADVEAIAEDVEYRINEAESGAIGIVDKRLPDAIRKLNGK